MKWSAVILGLVPVLILSACKSTGAYYERLAYWEGQHVDRLIEEWGVPKGTYPTSDGGKVIEFERTENIDVPAITTYSPSTTYHTGTITNAAGGYATYSGTSRSNGLTTTPGYTITESCSTTFWIKPNGYVRKTEAKGNGCKAEEMTENEKVQASLARQKQYKEIERERAEYFKNKKRDCTKDGVVKQLTYADCKEWGGKRQY